MVAIQFRVLAIVDKRQHVAERTVEQPLGHLQLAMRRLARVQMELRDSNEASAPVPRYTAPNPRGLPSGGFVSNRHTARTNLISRTQVLRVYRLIQLSRPDRPRFLAPIASSSLRSRSGELCPCLQTGQCQYPLPLSHPGGPRALSITALRAVGPLALQCPVDVVPESQAVGYPAGARSGSEGPEPQARPLTGGSSSP